MALGQKPTRVLRVVVVSPGDVTPERKALQGVVDELNRDVAPSYGCRLSLWRWETDARPGLHLQGPQGLIDHVMRIEEADIVVGIFWRRFGTPTSKASSGTEHELRRAWAAWKKLGRPDVMLYFCHREHTPRTSDELEQWKRVLHFKELLPSEQLHWQYVEVEDFERHVRGHLTKKVLAGVTARPDREPARHIASDDTELLLKIAGTQQLSDAALEKFRKDLRQEVAHLADPSVAPHEMLARLGLLEGDAPTRAAVLLFGVDPQRELPPAVVQCVQYDGADRSADRISQAGIEGNLQGQIDAALAFIRDRVPRHEHPVPESARSRVEYAYPMICMREIVVNALVHRDYADLHRHIHIRIYSDRVEILGPGTWFAEDAIDGEVPLRRLESQSVKRNPVLAQTMSLIRYFEGEGSGLPTALQDAAKLGAPEPVARFENGFVVVTIFPVAQRTRAKWKLIGAASAIVAATLAAIFIVFAPGERREPLRIYSSLPEREQRSAATAGRRSASTKGMQDAMRLALAQAKGRAGDFDVVYVPLDSSDVTGQSPAAVVQANARRAADDPNTVMYIGDLTSSAAQLSIPILSLARTPQISAWSPRVGLTQPDPLGDVDEPARYYPSGYRNFVRLTPNANVAAKAVLAVMVTDHCTRVAMVSNASPDGTDLATHILSSNHRRVRFVLSESVTARGRYATLVARAKRLQADCFVYSGSRNPNTVAIFTAFARALPTARLYGAAGVGTASFVGGLSPPVADRVRVMVALYDSDRFRKFAAAFRNAFYDEPDPNAAYAYEAMKLALNAIARSKTGTRDDVTRALFQTSRRLGILGNYSITATGDTNVASFGVSRIRNGTLSAPARTPRLRPR